MKYVIEHYRRRMFYNDAKGMREYVVLEEATRYATAEEAMHIVRMNPALDLCVLQVDR